ncbi:PLC-like phosphodiesterase [Lipomyces oligophaga]|uniref:PLC-like phosphodiesterase n=1 Tax=Lipomyces oligophaga TaxID=45792 RepID=UPI0034CD38A3
MTSVESFAAREVIKSGEGAVEIKYKRPLVIGHRGYSLKYPENTIIGLVSAIEAGSDAVEFDVHISADNHVVISHDPATQRVFGSNKGPIIGRNYIGDLDQLRTTKEPHLKMALFSEVVDLFLTNPAFAGKWFVVDVKIDNDLRVIELMAKVLTQIKEISFWTDKIILGIWVQKFLPLCAQHLPGIPIMHIGVDIGYAERTFLTNPNVTGLSMLLSSLYCTEGYALISKARKLGKGIYVWTVNSDESMKFSMASRFDAILTDDPIKLICLEQDIENYMLDDNRQPESVLSIKTKAFYYSLGFVARTFGSFRRQKFE